MTTIGVLQPGGINFGNTTLAYFQEGTWTPTIISTGTNFTSVTYVTQKGWYSKIGSTVFINFIVQWSNTSGSPSGTLQIAGLPFASNANSYSGSGCSYTNIVTPSTNTPTVTLEIIFGTQVINVNAVGQGFAAVNCTASANSGATSRYITSALFYYV